MTSSSGAGSDAPGARRGRARSPLVLIALGAWLARRGFLAWVSLGVAAVTVIGLVVLGFVLAARGRAAPVHDVPILASSGLAWGGGFLLAFSAAAHALRRDRESGVWRMLGSPQAPLRDYLVMRVGGLTALLAVVVGGGTVAVGIAAAALGAPAQAWKILATTLASSAFALGFAAVAAPMALAALGARSRVGGYAFLVVVLVLPELLVALARGVLPEAVAEVLSVPSALVTLRTALLPGVVDLARAANALASLAVFAALTTWLVARAAAVVLREGGPA